VFLPPWSIFSDLCGFTDGRERSERKSSRGRGKETNVYFGLGAKIARERHFLDIYGLEASYVFAIIFKNSMRRDIPSIPLQKFLQ